MEDVESLRKLFKFYVQFLNLCARYRKIQKQDIRRNLFQKVLILVQKAPKLVRFKKDLEKKLKISKTIAKIPKA